MKLIGACITTDDAPRLAAFYEIVFRQKPFVEGTHYGFHDAQLAVYDPGDVCVAPEKNMSLMYHVESVQAEYDRLLREIPGIRVTSPPERRPWGALSFWFLDPDGNMISFVEKEA